MCLCVMRVADGGREALWGGRGNSLIKLAVYVYSPLGSNNPFVRSTFSLLVIMRRKFQERSTRSMRTRTEALYLSRGRMNTIGSIANSAEQPVAATSPTTPPPNSAAQPVQMPMAPMVPIFEVARRNGMWWSIPFEMSQALYEKYTNNEDACQCTQPR